MSMTIRPDGPAAARVRGLLYEIQLNNPKVEALCMALAREIDRLGQSIADHLQEHLDQER